MNPFTVLSDGKRFGRREVATGLVTARQIPRGDWWATALPDGRLPSGVYVLLDDLRAYCYVGHSDQNQGVVGRIKGHNTAREGWWSHAIYFTALPFESQARLKEWVESRLWSVAEKSMRMVGSQEHEDRQPSYGDVVLNDVLSLLSALNVPIAADPRQDVFQFDETGGNGADEREDVFPNISRLARAIVEAENGGHGGGGLEAVLSGRANAGDTRKEWLRRWHIPFDANGHVAPDAWRRAHAPR